MNPERVQCLREAGLVVEGFISASKVVILEGNGRKEISVTPKPVTFEDTDEQGNPVPVKGTAFVPK